MAHTTLSTPERNKARMPEKPGPKEATIQRLLNYSKALKVVDAPPVGKMGIVLN